MKRLPYLVSILMVLLLSLPACNEKEVVTPSSVDTFLADIIGIDEEEQILLHNGEDIDLTISSLSLDDDEIVFNNNTSTQMQLGEAYETEWRNNTYRFFRTELPILKIQTQTPAALSEVYESAKFALVENGQITLNGNLGFKLRGNTSLFFPKKSYRLELWEDSEGAMNRDASVLGMRSDDDWLLDGMWNEPLSIRDKSAMKMWLAYGRVQDPDEADIVLGAAREYCELFINGSYKGLYYLGERLDRKQLKLETCTSPSDGGELYKAKAWDQAVIAFSLPEYDNSSLFWSGYEVKYPQEAGKYDWQKLSDFITFFKGDLPDNFEGTYPQKVDIDNIIDYFIQINILGAFDNAGNNVYIARKNQSSPYYFVSWDYDATVGLGIDGATLPVEYNFMQHVVTRRLFFSATFRDQLKVRWRNLRSDLLSNENILSYYRANHAILLRNKVYEREESVTRLEKSSPGVSAMIFLETTLNERLQYLDEAIENL